MPMLYDRQATACGTDSSTRVEDPPALFVPPRRASAGGAGIPSTMYVSVGMKGVGGSGLGGGGEALDGPPVDGWPGGWEGGLPGGCPGRYTGSCAPGRAGSYVPGT